jgi:serine/threonine protein kinase
VGAHSFVYLVQEEESRMLLAEKAVTLPHAREVREDLMREVKVLSMVDHENIIKLYHCYASETHLNLVMEYA